MAVLILTAVLFVTSIQRPTTGRDSASMDLGRIASGTLGNLETYAFEDPADPDGDDLKLEGWVTRVLEDDSDVAEVVDDWLRESFGGGLRYSLRLDNGVEAMHLLPSGDPPEPRAGRAAQSFLLPNWTAFANETQNATAVVPPGGALDYSGWIGLRSPFNSTMAPDGGTWLDWWDEHEPESTAERSHVPKTAFYGTWQYDDGGDCPCFVHIGLPDGRESDHAVYGLQMVVWLGA